jgi:hypothetical protein
VDINGYFLFMMFLCLKAAYISFLFYIKIFFIHLLPSSRKYDGYGKSADYYL